MQIIKIKHIACGVSTIFYIIDLSMNDFSNKSIPLLSFITDTSDFYTYVYHNFGRIGPTVSPSDIFGSTGPKKY